MSFRAQLYCWTEHNKFNLKCSKIVGNNAMNDFLSSVIIIAQYDIMNVI